MSEFGHQIAEAYDHAAVEFAQINAEMPQQLLEMGTQLLARLGPAPRILDLGCGSGRDMAWLEAQGAVVTGVDLSAGMLEQARRIVTGTLRQMDMCELDFPAVSSMPCGAAHRFCTSRKQRLRMFSLRYAPCLRPRVCSSWPFRKGAVKCGKEEAPSAGTDAFSPATLARR